MPLTPHSWGPGVVADILLASHSPCKTVNLVPNLWAFAVPPINAHSAATGILKVVLSTRDCWVMGGHIGNRTELPKLPV